MSKTVKRHEMSSFGGRLAFYRKKAKLTQHAFAEQLHTTRQLVAAWEKNERQSYTPYLKEICSLLNVDENLLLNGVSKENQVAASELGLTEESIKFLKGLKACDYYYPFTETDSDELNATSIGDGFVFDGYRRAYDAKEGGFYELRDYLRTDIEGGYPDEMFSIINLLLSTSTGWQILAMMYKFVSINFSESYVDGERVHFLRYNVNNAQKKETEIPTSLMKYALLQAISSKLEDLRTDYEGDK